MPTAVPGVVFLSGGQSEEEATQNLNAMNQVSAALLQLAWEVHMSYNQDIERTLRLKHIFSDTVPTKSLFRVVKE